MLELIAIAVIAFVVFPRVVAFLLTGSFGCRRRR